MTSCSFLCTRWIKERRITKQWRKTRRERQGKRDREEKKLFFCLSLSLSISSLCKYSLTRKTFFLSLADGANQTNKLRVEITAQRQEIMGIRLVSVEHVSVSVSLSRLILTSVCRAERQRDFSIHIFPNDKSTTHQGQTVVLVVFHHRPNELVDDDRFEGEKAK